VDEWAAHETRLSQERYVPMESMMTCEVPRKTKCHIWRMMACLVMNMRCGNAKRTDKEFLNVKRGDAEEQIDPEMGWWRRGHIRFMSMRGGGGMENNKT